MTRRFINQIGEGENVDQVFLASDKQLRTNRNGNLYLQVRLSDRSGSLVAMLWNANERIYRSFENGDYVRAVGATQIYQGGLQMIASKVERSNTNDIDESDFVTLGRRQLDQLLSTLADSLRQIETPALRDLAECFLMDETLMKKFATAPAGVKLHHAYQGGLLQHVVKVMRLCDLIAPEYPDVDGELLRLGAFLHDLGKVDELVYDRELGYSDEGQMLGHVILGVSLLERKIAEVEHHTQEAFPAEVAMRLKHMILSHHGTLEFGSPKVPMTLEAMVLHYADTLDSKLFAAEQLIRDDANSDSAWTPYHQPTGRKLYKPSLRGASVPQGDDSSPAPTADADTAADAADAAKA
ncbi:MAG: HD domain-containing protein [Planctomycetales bacterium]|nr:HD domain-containing protein [Planctomycetales bacterium]